MPEGADFQRRLPSVSKAVAEVTGEDIRVSVLGTVIDRQEGMAVIDDGTGRIRVSVEGSQKADINRVVRVFGRVIPLENGVELQGDVIQDMSGLDLGLHRTVEEIWKRL